MIARVLLSGTLMLLCAVQVEAQARPMPSSVFHVVRVTPAVIGYSPRPPEAKKGDRAPLWAPLASLLLPGAGQAVMKQQRSVGYLAVEGFLWAQAIQTQRDVTHGRADFREIAANVARVSFGPDRPNGSWDYYEILEERNSSGQYNKNPAGKFTPETDTSTYNGAQWFQARQTYWADPDVAPAENSAEYQQALTFYKNRAANDNYRWSWFDHQLEQAEYAQRIRDANASKQRYVSTVGLIAANHLISMVDAYISVRVRRYGGAGLGTSVGLETRSIGDPRYGNIGTALKVSMAFP